MSTQANTRLFKGSVLKVDDLAMGYVSTGLMVSTSGFGSASTIIDVTTAASSIDESLIGLPDQGDATFEFFLDMNDGFQQEMEEMRDAQQTRTFILTLPEGTKNTLTFSASVIDTSITATTNDVYKMTLVLCITSAIGRTAV